MQNEPHRRPVNQEYYDKEQLLFCFLLDSINTFDKCLVGFKFSSDRKLDISCIIDRLIRGNYIHNLSLFLSGFTSLNPRDVLFLSSSSIGNPESVHSIFSLLHNDLSSTKFETQSNRLFSALVELRSRAGHNLDRANINLEDYPCGYTDDGCSQRYLSSSQLEALESSITTHLFPENLTLI